MNQMKSFSERLYSLEVSSLAKDNNRGNDSNYTKTESVEMDKMNRDKTFNYDRQDKRGIKRGPSNKNDTIKKRKEVIYSECSDYDLRKESDIQERQGLHKRIKSYGRERNENILKKEYSKRNTQRYESDGFGGTITESEPVDLQEDSDGVERIIKESETVSWATVVGRNRKNLGVSKRNKVITNASEKSRKVPASIKRRLPKTAAVCLTCTKEDYNYLSAMKKAKTGIELESCGINEVSVKRSITGGIIFEILGPDANDKALLLESKLKQLFNESGVVITRPFKKADIKLTGLEESVTANDIILAIVDMTGCNSIDIKCSGIRTVRNGLCVAWLQCPLDAAYKLSEAKKVKIGWASARVEILEARPLQCYRCLAPSHPYQRCPSEKDRSNCCFRCGEIGHFAVSCRNPVRCPICTEAKRGSDHRAGSVACMPIPPRGFSPINKIRDNNGDKNIMDIDSSKDNMHTSSKSDRRTDIFRVDPEIKKNG